MSEGKSRKASPWWSESLSEALALRWEDVYFERRVALIRETKIGAEREAHLPPPLVVALANIKREKNRGVFRYTAKPATA
jgi:integrase